MFDKLKNIFENKDKKIENLVVKFCMYIFYYIQEFFHCPSRYLLNNLHSLTFLGHASPPFFSPASIAANYNPIFIMQLT